MKRSATIGISILGLLGILGLVGNPLAAIAFGQRSALYAWTDGLRASVIASAVTLGLSFVVGTAVGGFAAFGPTIAGALLGRVMEIAGALPSLVTVLVLRSVLPVPSLLSVGIVVAVLRGLATAKVVRAEALRLMASDFVLAARAIGSSKTRMFRTHVLPHLADTALAGAALVAASVVGLDAALSFLGFASDDSSFGSLIAEAAGRSEPRLAVAPALAIAAIIAGLHLVGEAMDTRTNVGRRFV